MKNSTAATGQTPAAPAKKSPTWLCNPVERGPCVDGARCRGLPPVDVSDAEPLDLVLGSAWDIHDPRFETLVRPLQKIVKQRELWACHLGPELGGRGYGQVKLALINEILGRSHFAPIVFGCHEVGRSRSCVHDYRICTHR